MDLIEKTKVSFEKRIDEVKERLMELQTRDSKEIQNFIDDSIETGEGLLIYSDKGNNTAFIILII